MSKHKLLLADDSITIQKVVNLTFADEGIEVISVGDGNSAMEKFAEDTPDLVMADINMPGLSGYEICERIKGNEATRRIPVILLVGSFEPFDEEEAERVGANDYLTKPFQSIRQLVSKVSDLLAASANGEEVAEETDAPPSSFDDTLDLDKVSSGSDELGDAGMDDEMIQSYQGGGYTYDETPKFQSQTESEPRDYAKTQPLSAADLNEITSNEAPQTSADFSEQTMYNYSAQESPAQEIASEETYQSEQEITSEETYQPEYEAPESESFSRTEYSQPEPMPEAVSDMELDEANLLELPPRESFTPTQAPPPVFEDYIQHDEYESTPEPSPETASEEASEVTSEAATSETEEVAEEVEEPAVSAETPAQAVNLSPEIIDAIAAKVVEKISDKVIREIAWEVVPQMTDLIVKRMAEEKLKE